MGRDRPAPRRRREQPQQPLRYRRGVQLPGVGRRVSVLGLPSGAAPRASARQAPSPSRQRRVGRAAAGQRLHSERTAMLEAARRRLGRRPGLDRHSGGAGPARRPALAPAHRGVAVRDRAARSGPGVDRDRRSVSVVVGGQARRRRDQGRGPSARRRPLSRRARPGRRTAGAVRGRPGSDGGRTRPGRARGGVDLGRHRGAPAPDRGAGGGGRRSLSRAPRVPVRSVPAGDRVSGGGVRIAPPQRKLPAGFGLAGLDPAIHGFQRPGQRRRCADQVRARRL